MRESKWYGLRIPEQDDEYNVDDFGAAFDKTDDALHRLSAALETESELVRIDHGLGTYPQVTLGALQYGLGVAGPVPSCAMLFAVITVSDRLL